MTPRTLARRLHWRDHGGRDVDVLIELGAEALPIEVKSAMTVPSDALAGLQAFGTISGRTARVLVYGGADAYRRGEHAVQTWEGVS